MKQAEAKKYKEMYSHNGKDILVMGINFSSKTRNIGTWKGVVFSSSLQSTQEIVPTKENHNL